MMPVLLGLAGCAVFAALPALLYWIERCRLHRDCRDVANHISVRGTAREVLSNEEDSRP